MLACHSRRNCGTSTSAPARNVSITPANVPTNDSQSGTVTVNRFPTATPAASSISATDSPISIDTMLARRIVIASSAANARSLTAHLQDVVPQAVEAISPRAVRREPHRVRALYPPPARQSRNSLDSLGESECAGRWWLHRQDARTRPVLPGVALHPFNGDLDSVHRGARAEVRLAAVVQDVHVRLLLLPLEPPALGRVGNSLRHDVRHRHRQ